MKKRILSMVALVLTFLIFLSACAETGIVNSTTEEKGEISSTETAAQTKETEETKETTPKKDPKDIKNILMIGNSFCYYFVEELHAMAKADGYNITVANLYKSGCRLHEHWSWYQTKAEGNYQLFVTDSSGRKKVSTTISLNDALKYKKWDVISLQQHYDPSEAVDYATALATTKPYAKNLLDAFKKDCPDAILYWFETWAYQVGYKGAYTTANRNNNFANVAAAKQVLTVEKQTANYQAIMQASKTVAQENGLDMIPSGDAFQLARANPVIGDTLCARLGYAYPGAAEHSGDNYHDGDVGGGQYLNACVWYETVMGQSCLDNTYRPVYTKDNKTYSFTEDQINALKNAAHQAVAAIYGADYAK